MIAGGCTDHRRRKRDSATSTSSSDKPKNRGGRPRKSKKSFNFAPAARQVQPQSPNEHPSTPRQARSNRSTIVTCSTRRTRTRTSRPLRSPVPINRYVAGPATPTRKGPSFNWPLERTRLQQTINNLVTREKYREKVHQALLSAHYQLLFQDVPPDRSSVPEAIATPPSILSAKDLHKFVQTTMKHAPQDAMANTFRLLGIHKRNLSKCDKKESLELLTKGFCTLIQYHLGRYSDAEAADALGEIFFSNKLFDDNAVKPVMIKVTRSVTTSLFTSVAILRSIDCHAGALNDTGVNQLSQIEAESNLVVTKRGTSMILKRWKITQARKLANEFVCNLLKIKHTPDSEFGDYIEADIERLFRYAVEAYGLREQAIDRGIEVAITGDGAAITTSSSTAGQCCIGFKMIDVNSKDPTTGEPMYYDDIEGDGETPRRVYKNSQSVETCLPIAMVEAKESNDLIRTKFGRYFIWCCEASSNGIDENGDEPSFAKINCVCNGDYSFLRKVTNCGGACKRDRKFCIYCEVDGTDNMFHTVSGSERCDICKTNSRNTCPHRAVNDWNELETKGRKLLLLLLEDYKEVHDNPNATVLDVLPEMAVECFDGYDDSDNKVAPDIFLRDTITTDGRLTRYIYDYCRHLVHTEEDTNVCSKTKLKLDENAVGKEQDVFNIDYVLRHDDKDGDKTFHLNVLHDLRLRYKPDRIPTCKLARVLLLRKRLLTQSEIRRYRDAFLVYERSLQHRLMCPGLCIPCVLHHNNRTTEKVLQQILLAGMSLNVHRLDEYLEHISLAVNRDVFGKKNIQDGKSIGWKVPVTEKKQLDDVKLSNTQARPKHPQHITMLKHNLVRQENARQPTPLPNHPVC